MHRLHSCKACPSSTSPPLGPLLCIFFKCSPADLDVNLCSVILGIGADDLFVFADAWKQSQCTPHVSSSVALRFQWSWTRAFNSMTITSITTATGFLLVATNDVPVISSFGLLACVLVLSGYLMAITWFSACVVIHHTYVVDFRGGFFAKNCLGCLLPICAHNWSALATGIEENSSRDAPSQSADVKRLQNLDDEHQNRTRVQDWFFCEIWYPLLHKRGVRLTVLGIFGCTALTGVLLSSVKVRLSTQSVMVTRKVDAVFLTPSQRLVLQLVPIRASHTLLT